MASHVEYELPSISRREAWTVLRRAAAAARRNDISLTARALAYSLFLAIPATTLLLLGVFSMVADEQALQRLIVRARTVMPDEATTLLEDSLRRSIESTRGSTVMVVAGLVLAVWTTTTAATTLMTALTLAFDREDRRSFLRRRLLSFVIVLCLVAAALLVFGLLVLGPYLERWLGSATGAPTVVAWAWWLGQWPILIGAILIAFAVLLYVGPDVEQSRWRFVTPGALVALAIWLVVSGAFALYVSHFGSYDKTWGTLSAVIVMLVWLWLTSAALLFGAEINAEAQRRAAGGAGKR
jgi:membrane protein